MFPLARLRTASLSTLLSISVSLLPFEGAFAATPLAVPLDPGTLRANAALDAPCTSDTPQQIADANVDDTTANPNSDLPAMSASTAPSTTTTAGTAATPSASTTASTDAAATPAVSASASPAASATATAIPEATVAPFVGPLRGAGELVVPSATASPGITPPPVPTPTVAPVASAGPIFLSRGTPKPSASATPSDNSTPKPLATLGPNQIAVLADTVEGGASLDKPSDAIGNVHVYFRDGVLVGDHAHYDGQRYITLYGTPGHDPYIEDATHDSRLSGETIVFDMVTNRAVLKNGKGQTTRGVQSGHIHYTAHNLVATSNGTVHGDHASFSTCENPKGGYHVTARTIDVIPGQKMIAKGATVFLGALAIFFIPVLSIPLNRSTGERRPVVFAPEMGYDSADGFYVRARIGFGTTDTYYGYYRVEEYSRRGFGLGYVAFMGSRNGRRKVNVNLYAFNNNASTGGGEQNNFSVQDQEVFSKHLQAQVQGTYTSEYGPYVDLPPSYSFTTAINHTTDRSTQSYSFSKTAVGSTQSTINAAFQDTYKISPSITQAFDLNYAENINSYAGVTTPTSSLHINSLTHAATRNADYTFTIDQTDSATPSGYNSIPEFIFHPHSGHGIIPIDTQFTIGDYHEVESYTDSSGDIVPGREASRAELAMTAGPAVFKVLKTSTFSATAGANQYYYSTGDLKAQTSQTMNLTTPISSHISNVIQYQEQNLAGPQNLPFQYLDVLGGVSHNAQETMNFSNGGIYTFTLTTGTGFNHQAQPISYQLISRPSSRSYFSVGGSYMPGGGLGFEMTNVQLSTPIGKDQSIEFTSNVDWKNKGRLEDKNIYFRKIVGNCYDIRVSYNQDLKSVNLSLDLLAFPTQGVNFGYVSQQQAIFPQNFALQ